MKEDEMTIPRLWVLSLVLSLMLPLFLGAATGPPYSLAAVKAKLPPPPLPGEEALVPLLGNSPQAMSPGKRDKPVTDPPLPPPTCSLSQCDPATCPLGPNRACLLQTFQDIQWRLCVYASQFGTPSMQASKGLEIGQVYLRRLFVPNDPWKQILYRAGLADLFTVYHSRLPDDPGFYETQYISDWSLARRTVTQADAGPNGALITLAQDASFGPAVAAECRDRGIAWLCKQNTSVSRRGQELVLWGILDTGNYDFITEYGFRDDGTITMRVGATGYNDPHRPSEAHMHDGLWRIDMDLNGGANNTAYLVEHHEPTSSDGRQATDTHDLFNDGFEGAEKWDPLTFTSLLVEDTAVNSYGEHLGYELEPLRTGNARHYGYQSGLLESWSQYDFWVSQWHPSEDTSWAVPWKNPDQYLFPYVSNVGPTGKPESIVNQDLVLWYYASAHHDPIDEDRDSHGNFAVTLTHWYGLELHPHNFFDRNPLGAPDSCGN
jgi:Cu2+-containing amine oxidase